MGSSFVIVRAAELPTGLTALRCEMAGWRASKVDPHGRDRRISCIERYQDLAGHSQSITELPIDWVMFNRSMIEHRVAE